jgi:ISXO2-like transposase domain
MFARLTALGYTHLATPGTKDGHKVENPDTIMAGPHMVSSLLKRGTTGPLHYRLSYQHMPYYLDEFTFRFNRRTSHSRGMMFYRVLQLAVGHDPVRYRDLVQHPRPRDPSPTPPGATGHPLTLERPQAHQPWRHAHHSG